MKNIFNKKLFDKNQLSNICIFILIVLFSCLIIYQIYLAIIHKQDKNYSKLVEGFSMTNITPQGNVTCSSTTALPNNFYNIIITDISNIETLYNNVNGIGNQVNGIINTNNSNSSNTSVNTPTLNKITPPNTITSKSNAFDFCNVVNTNWHNINLINENINNIFDSLKQLPDGESATNNTTFTSLTNVNNIQCQNQQNVPINNVCQNENTNISNINALHANTISLNNAVSSLQNTQTTQANNQYKSASMISNSAGVNP
uniref:Uncharacterized protein n=1 Tax=viral metagenome TaxID=1070528 RepID=A0A6C0EJ55_9ZZZZ